ncbi:MAG: hypothetical protein Q7J45_01010 [bacterium]|nr:hypothetical protein [bacterium]
MLIITILLLASSLSFGLGYLAGRDTAQTTQFSLVEVSPENISPEVSPGEGKVVASRNGTKYYLPQCSGATRISDANKVWFESIDVARRAGYSPATNCPGI